jgi:hypothetical protein
MKCYEFLTKQNFGQLETETRFPVPLPDNKFDIIKAIHHCYGPKDSHKMRRKFSEGTQNSDIGLWNDTHSYEEVVAKLRELNI